MLYALADARRVKASRELSRGEYQCPYAYCSSPTMILKKGTKKRPHFAHKQTSNCDRYSERETDAHIAMKEYQQKFLNISEEYVEYGGIKEVRPDLVWQRRFAIEVQNSTISVEEIERRNAIYRNEGLIPVWIFHGQELEGNNYFTEVGIYKAYHEGSDDREYTDLVKLKSAEIYLLQLQGSLCYLSFDSDYYPEDPIFEYETFEPVPDRGTLFIASSEIQQRNNIFHSPAEFEEWVLDYPGGRKKAREKEERQARLQAQEQKDREEELLRVQQEELMREARLKAKELQKKEPEERLRIQEQQKRELEERLRMQEREEKRREAAVKAEEREEKEQKARLMVDGQEEDRIFYVWLDTLVPSRGTFPIYCTSCRQEVHWNGVFFKAVERLFGKWKMLPQPDRTEATQYLRGRGVHMLLNIDGTPHECRENGGNTKRSDKLRQLHLEIYNKRRCSSGTRKKI